MILPSLWLNGPERRIYMKKILLSTVLVILILLTACNQVAPMPEATPANASASITLMDGLKREVTLPMAAQKVISLAPSNTEILYAIGAGAQMIGRDSFSDYPAEAKNLPDIGGKSGLNMEMIANMKPDLVLAGGINTPEQVKAFEDLKITVYYVANPTDLDGMYENVKTVSQLVGKEKEADALIASLKQKVQKVDDVLKGVSERPRVFYELDASEPAKPWTAGKGSFIDQLIVRAGGINAAGELDAWAQISQEELLVQNPDVIILGDATYGVSVEQVAQRPGWDKINAVKNQKVYPFDDNLVSRPDPRMVDALVGLAKLIHPEIADKLQ